MKMTYLVPDAFLSTGRKTVWKISVPTLILYEIHTRYSFHACFAFLPEPRGRWEDGRGGPRGSTRTVSTLDNAMPCHRTGCFKRKIPTPVIKINWQRISKENKPKRILTSKGKFSMALLFVLDRLKTQAGVSFGDVPLYNTNLHWPCSSFGTVCASQALSTSNIIFNLLLTSLCTLRTLEPTFSYMQVTKLI